MARLFSRATFHQRGVWSQHVMVWFDDKGLWL